VSDRQRLARLRQLMAGRRFVVCDTETSGVTADARLLAIACVELWADINGEARAWYINPGRFRMDPKAAAKNRITAEHLRDRPTFALAHGELEPWLLPGPQDKHVLVGHNVAFDARRLAYEYRMLGLALPALTLLDTQRLANAAGVTCGPSLAELLAALNIGHPAAHTAMGDALVTAQAARLLLEQIAEQADVEQLHTLLDTLVTTFAPDAPDITAERQRAETEPALSDEHAEAHTRDLRDGRSRRRALDICLGDSCAHLATRMEDGIISPAGAQQVVEWALTHLESGELDRRLAGRVLAGLGRALRRCEKPTYVEEVLLTRLTPLLQKWGPCTTTERCGRCLHEAGTCRFTEAGRQAIDAFLYDPGPYPVVRKAAAEAYLPGFDPASKRARGRPPEGLYQRLRRLDLLDAAGYGATRVAEYRRDQGVRGWGYAVAHKAWDDGCRTPQLADLLASMTVLDGVGLNRRGADPKAHVRDAVAIIETCLATHAGETGGILRRLERRRDRLQLQLTSPQRSQVATPRNLRKARPSTPGTAPLTVSP
jgi:DNA polymerase III epsilon subunit-like protein